MPQTTKAPMSCFPHHLCAQFWYKKDNKRTKSYVAVYAEHTADVLVRQSADKPMTTDDKYL
jgi:hypothetical protein